MRRAAAQAEGFRLSAGDESLCVSPLDRLITRRTNVAPTRMAQDAHTCFCICMCTVTETGWWITPDGGPRVIRTPDGFTVTNYWCSRYATAANKYPSRLGRGERPLEALGEWKVRGRERTSRRKLYAAVCGATVPLAPRRQWWIVSIMWARLELEEERRFSSLRTV